ncbi:BgTH12-05710 [Blumeria graminis f. sp. triticale]|uniref:BgTH12-05710 n=1 Tax=Blumeria graminis f. sp. triticale TaxID=1689686 RepID=A0A9W4D4E9_BLUGR|nr:BgTH12-05710 [Blumeria graminis f. sp. triticale]
MTQPKPRTGRLHCF